MVSLFCVSAAFVVSKIMSIMYGTIVPVTYDKSVQVHTLLVASTNRSKRQVFCSLASCEFKDKNKLQES